MRRSLAVVLCSALFFCGLGLALRGSVLRPPSGTWTPAADLGEARAGASASALADGRILLASASDFNVHFDWDAFSTAEIFDPAAGRFSPAGYLPVIDVAAIRRLGVEVPDVSGMPGGVGRLVAVPGGDAVLIGHEEWWKHEGQVVRSFRFLAGDRSWVEIGEPFAWVGNGAPPVSTPTVSRLGAVTAVLADGSVVVVGGSIGGEVSWTDDERPPMSTERYDPLTGTWSRLPDVPASLFELDGLGLVDGTLLLVGGLELEGSGEDAHLEWTGASYRLVFEGG
jgi:hypothetical protein